MNAFRYNIFEGGARLNVEKCMEDSLYKQIIQASNSVDERFLNISAEELERFRISFPVPGSHNRSKAIKSYDFIVSEMGKAFSDRSTVVFIDSGLKKLEWVSESISKDAQVFWIKPKEEETKDQARLDQYIEKEQLRDKGFEEAVAIGGGIVLNAVAYIAEKLESDLVYVPTTLLAMCDGSIGGKVRANLIENGIYKKHAYKSYYEPNQVIVGPRFLESLPEKQISIGMGEVLKHGVYQSERLLDYIASNDFRPFENKNDLLKVVLWTAALKGVCFDIDPEETPDGAEKIIRGAHNASDKIEEASNFTIPHGLAVTQAIYNELVESKSPLLPIVENFLNKMRIDDMIL